MAQYRSQWTGEVIDDAVGKAKNITYLTVGVDAEGAFAKAEAAYGVSPLYAIKYVDGISQGDYYKTFRCYKKEDDSSSKRTYYFESYVQQGVEMYALTRDGSNYAWSESTYVLLASLDDLEYYSQKSDIGIVQRQSHATRNISKGEYVVFGSSLCTAITDISEGDRLNAVLAVPNHNLERVQDGGLNDLKSAINSVQDDIAIRVVGNKTTYASGAAIGQYVIVDGSTITGITDGLYKAAKAIPYDTAIDDTYLTAASGGAANDLKSDIVNVENDLNQRMGRSVVGASVSLQCSSAIVNRAYVCLLISGEDVVLVTLHYTTYSAVSLKTGNAKATSRSNYTITVSGLDERRYYLFDPTNTVLSIS